MDRAALEREMATLHPRSFGWALACCGWDRQEAEDVLQTAYLKVLDGRARFAGRSGFGTFLFAVIRKTAADRRRRRLVMTLGLSRLAVRAPEVEAVRPDPDAMRVRTALSRLAARQREVLDLVFYHDLTIEQAAAVMGVSVGTARVHYERGKKRLLAELG